MSSNNCETCAYKNSEINRHKLDKLDDAFLFALGIVGLFFTIVQVYQKADLNSFIAISPLLVLGVALPFYVGYVRGAIHDSLIERLRGWIYLVVGVSAYCALILLTSDVGVLSFFSFVFVLLAFFSIGYIARWFKQIFQFKETPQNLFSISGTVMSSFILAYGFVFIPKIFALSDFSLILVQLAIAYPSIIIAFMSEKLSRHAQTANLEPSYNRVINDLKGNFKKFRFLQLVFLLSVQLTHHGVKELFKSAKWPFILTFVFLLVGTFTIENQNVFVQLIPNGVSSFFIISGFICFSIAAFLFLRKKQLDLC